MSAIAAGAQYHDWAVQQWKLMKPPFITCEPVLTEGAFLLRRKGGDPDALFTFLDRGAIRIGLDIEEERAVLRASMRRYRNRPMSLADAGNHRALLVLIDDFGCCAIPLDADEPEPVFRDRRPDEFQGARLAKLYRQHQSSEPARFHIQFRISYEVSEWARSRREQVWVVKGE